ncbi:type I polyketide synthase [Haliangium ochraceum]|uniref:KR domain protein n=1 Tax=Haliangium ochraceum (strain DSM 14365 / JCM 11303 / SMP-2) TaxID=502025 RepID=D0LQW2_HALO1|nr:type I polyketide synthase [Haliangium ochraceum]ACY15470.1 KR domain protein [Haliangium ochraceum DSM 14365]
MKLDRDELLAIEKMAQRLERLESEKCEPIAVVGAACRVPGCDNPEQLWALLIQGRDAVTSLAMSDGTSVPAGVVRDLDMFDAEFFRMAPREVLSMDARQRLVLEVSWEALERARTPAAKLEGTSVGVYVGVSGLSQLEGKAEAHDMTGSLAAVVAGRVSHFLGLRGPCLSVDTACSSSLVAVHLACKALRQRDCSVALAGGVGLHTRDPRELESWLALGNLGKSGRCRPFDAAADGIVGADGCGMLVLKRLSDARKDGDPLLAVLRGSAVNHDGRAQGLTVPSGLAQAALLRRALSDARVTAQAVSYVECHGTGTSLGDPIEAQALAEVFGESEREHPLLIGSLKSNIGHTDAAAGVLGLLKLVLALQHGRIPQSLHFDTPNPLIPWDSLPLRVAGEATAWPSNGKRRLGGVSSFGMSGTNAHVIVEEAPPAGQPANERGVAGESPVTYPVLLSSRSDSGLRSQAQRLLDWVTERADVEVVDVAYSLATTRSHFESRAVVYARDRQELLASLQALTQGAPGSDASKTRVGRDRLAVLFTGQGSQRARMGAELSALYPVFRASLEEACALLDRELGVEPPLLEVLSADDESPAGKLLEQTMYAQCGLFALEVSLFRLLQSWGLEPTWLLGHSIGELVAAHVADVLSLEEACTLVGARARLMQALPATGAMYTVQASEREVLEALAGHGERAAVAASNSPTSTVISGDLQVVQQVAAAFEARERKTARLRVSHAFHSHHMDGMLAEFGRVAEGLRYRAPRIAIVSTATGTLAQPAELCSPQYWVQQVRATVRFGDGLQTLQQEGARTFLELGPHGVLTALGQEALPDAEGLAFLPTLRRARSESATTAEALGGLARRGYSPDWESVFKPYRPQKIALPTYAFQRERYWVDASAARPGDLRSAGLRSAEHPLLGAAVAFADNDGVLFTARLALTDHPWLAGHQLFGTVIFPGSGYAELALVAARHVGLDRVEELTLEAPLALPQVGAITLQVSVGAAESDGRRPLGFYARSEATPDAAWTRHASGWLAPVASDFPFEFRSWPPTGASAVSLDGFYPDLADLGFHYGPEFRGLQAVYRRGDELFAEVALPEPIAHTASQFAIHPALLDAALQTQIVDHNQRSSEVTVPFAWSEFSLHAVGATRLRVRFHRLDEGVAELDVADSQGEPVARMRGLRSRPAAASQMRRTPSTSEHLLRVVWTEAQAWKESTPRAAEGAVLGSWTPASGWSAGPEPARYDDLASLAAALRQGAAAPAWVLVPCISRDTPVDRTSETERVTAEVLARLQEWLADDRLSALRLVFLTHGAVATGPDQDVSDLVHAPLWGLVRSAQSEHPDAALVLLDSDESEASRAVLQAALAGCEERDEGFLPDRQLALRAGRLLAPRLVRGREADTLAPPQVATWRLDIPQKGTLERLALVPNPEANAPLSPGQVRIAVRAAGLNFRDVLDALGMYAGEPGPLGSECAGVVLEAADDVSDVAPGDRVMGLMRAPFSPTAIANHRKIVRMPAGWSFQQGGGAPLVYLTAYYGLVRVAKLQPGERVLIHAATGGVGMAGVQIARALGADVFATASPAKWDVLRRMGLDADHIASSRTLGFEREFLAKTGGQGVDVVLNSLAHEFVDASLTLLSRGGRFVEMGKTDLRDSSAVAADHPTVRYQAFDLVDLAPAQLGELLSELSRLFERGELRPDVIHGWDVRHAPRAFRALAQGHHVGKSVFTFARPIDPAGTVLITGGTGTLGGLLARHLVQHYGVRHLMLISRRGPGTPGVEALAEELESAGAHVQLLACDVTDRAALQHALEVVPKDHPLTAVIHAAGVIEDSVLSTLTPARLSSVMRAKVAGALHLHELTESVDLSTFILFSSLSGVIGSPGQANYAAANTFLDALAQHRRAGGLPALALAWGAWDETSELTAHLTEADRQRLRQMGFHPLPATTNLALFDTALAQPDAAVVAARFDRGSLDKHRNQTLPALFRDLAKQPLDRPRANNLAAHMSLGERLRPLSPGERQRILLELVQTEVASVLMLSSHNFDSQQPLQKQGLDSLMAVEIRNRLGAATGLRLPATLLFDYPTPAALASFFAKQLNEADEESSAAPVTAGPREAEESEIAIVGMGCRFPGGINSPQGLWQLLEQGQGVIGDFPSERGWQVSELYDPDPNAPGRSYTRRGSFLYDADRFDPAFFGISPREALTVDPQQRLLLETSWEALEQAGIDPTTLQGANAGVFAGVIYNDYGTRLWSLHRDKGFLLHAPDDLEGYMGVGSSPSVASGRIAYTFGLQGPALTVDTACSSSLVAIHLACQALRQGECTLALAGGVTVMATPGVFMSFSRQRALSPDGRCKAFSADADGTGWGEGAGMLLLERLSDAKRNGHPILAVLRGSAVNQDGKSQGLTAPNGPAQQRVILQALDNARLTPNQVDAVEAHGTGTKLGDPIEAQALLATYGQAHTPEAPVWLGSLKSNLGHTQAAAGVAGVMKMVLALQHQMLPATLHAQTPSPHIDWSSGTLQLVQSARPWQTNGQPRRAGVSSFGVSGTNAHLILEEAPLEQAATEQRAAATAPVAALPFLLSGKTEEALKAQAQRLHQHLQRHEDAALVDVSYSLATTRAHFEQRAALVASTREELLAALAALANGESAPSLVVAPRSADGKVVFVFPGQGSQWQGMGRALLRSSDAFRAEVEACEAAFAPYIDGSLREALEGGSSDRVDVLQPVLFTMMVSLAAHWRSLGVVAAAVVGHSQGEVAAAYVAGALSLDDAAQIVALRSRALRRVAGRGAMAAVELGAEQLATYLAPFEEQLAIGAVNSPRASLVAGQPAALDALLEKLAEDGVYTQKARGNHASHCRLVEPLAQELTDALQGIRPSTCAIPLYSTVTGTRLEGHELDADYWYQNLRAPVLFQSATERLLADGHDLFVELSPHPVLSLPLYETFDAREHSAQVVTSLRRGDGTHARMLLSLGELHNRGHKLDWHAFFAPWHPRTVPLPTYAFQYERFWLEAPAPSDADLTSAGLSAAEHPLLGASLSLAESNTDIFTARLAVAQHAWLTGHKVFDTVILPGTGFVELALAAAQRVGLARIEELILEAPLVLPEHEAVLVQLSVGAPDVSGHRPLQIYARPEQAAHDAWTKHASGLLAAAERHPDDLDFHLHRWPPQGATPVALEGLYAQLHDAGLDYGPDFQGLRAVYKRGDDLFAEVELPESLAKDAARFVLHPALLDAALHTLALDSIQSAADVALPFSWSGLSPLRAQGTGALRVRFKRAQDASDVFLQVADATGEPLLQVQALTARPVAAEQVRAAAASHGDLFKLHWTPLSRSQSHGQNDTRGWVMLSTDLDLASSLGLSCHASLASLCEAQSTDAPWPACVVVPFLRRSDAKVVGSAVHEASRRALTLLQEWLAEERLHQTRLVFLTYGAVAAHAEEDVPDLIHAPLWGLVRAAQAEHPHLPIFLVDSDDTEASRRTLMNALDELEEGREFILRTGQALIPSLARAARSTDSEMGGLATEGTVLITGGTGTLGSLLARHLVQHHGVKHLVLVSRQGATAEGANSLARELLNAGAAVTLAVCDVTDRAALAELLASIPAAHPLAAVVHTAGLLEDALIDSLTSEQLHRVMRAKVEAAIHLHELTSASKLSAFILFSSFAGVLGSAGQANYAAANTFLDGLAQHRRARGLPALAIDWGYWADRSAISEHLRDSDLQRFARHGLRALSAETGLALFDAALRRPEPVLVATELDTTLPSRQADALPLLLRRLIQPKALPRTTADTYSFARDLAELAPEERERALVELVRREAASVLGISSPTTVDPRRPLQELGLDSLMALEIRNRLMQATKLRLQATVLFDHPTPAALAQLIGGQMFAAEAGDERVLAQLDQLEALVSELSPGELGRSQLISRLKSLSSRLSVAASAADASAAPSLEAATDDELFEFYQQVSVTRSLSDDT